MLSIRRSHKDNVPYLFCGPVKIGRYIPASRAIEFNRNGKHDQPIVISIRQLIKELTKLAGDSIL